MEINFLHVQDAEPAHEFSMKTNHSSWIIIVQEKWDWCCSLHNLFGASNRCELELSFVVRVSTARALFRVLDSITTNQHRFRSRTNVIWPGACAKWTFVAPAKRKNKCPRTKRGGNNRGPILHRTFVYLGRDAFSEATHLFPGWMPTRTDINST